MLRQILSDIVCKTFLDVCGKFQIKKSEGERKAFVVEFSLPINYDTEEGYRSLQLAIYVREKWNVIPRSDMEFDEAEDCDMLKKGKDYVKGQSEWKRVMYHDSGWREGVCNVIKDNEKRLDGLKGDWYAIVNPSKLGLPEQN